MFYTVPHHLPVTSLFTAVRFLVSKYGLVSRRTSTAVIGVGFSTVVHSKCGARGEWGGTAVFFVCWGGGTAVPSKCGAREEWGGTAALLYSLNRVCDSLVSAISSTGSVRVALSISGATGSSGDYLLE